MRTGSIPVEGTLGVVWNMLQALFLERLKQEQESFLEIEEKLAQPDISQDESIWKDLLRQHAQKKQRYEKIQNYLRLHKEWEEAEELLKEEHDKEIREAALYEAQELQKQLAERRREMELLLLPSSPFEGRSIILEIRAGTGGEEAALFAADLMKMYLRLVERLGMQVEILSTAPTELGGYKELSISVTGERAYALLHQEGGGHRVQRIPSTESNGRIHTSAVTVAALPEREANEVEIKDSDLQIDVFRASGAGGQHVNKTESAIRISHLPSGLVVSCQDERSQHKNKARAMRILRSRLAKLEEKRSHAEHNSLKKEQIKSGDRSERIRTYNFPQGRVTDHRINYTSYNLEQFMNGEMLELLEALLRAEQDAQWQKLDSKPS